MGFNPWRTAADPILTEIEEPTHEPPYLHEAGAVWCATQCYSDSRKSFPNGVALLDKPAVAPTNESAIIFENRYKWSGPSDLLCRCGHHCEEGFAAFLPTVRPRIRETIYCLGGHMKKILVLVIAIALTVTLGVAAQAQHKADPADKGQKVYCCHGKGNCDKLHSKAGCEKDGGKVVNSCKECK